MSFVTLFFLTAGILTAQVSADPSDSFYDDARVWETMGLVSNLPPLRPYPLHVVEKILEEVMTGRSASQAEKARVQYERIFGKKVRVGAEAAGNFSVNNRLSSRKQLDLSAFVEGNALFLDIFSVSFDVRGLLTNIKDGNEVLPFFMSSPYDIASDDLRISIFNVYTDINASAAVGLDWIYFQSGLTRSSWGDFYDTNVVIGPQAFHTGNFSFVINRERWNYALSLFVISATDNFGRSTHPEKFMTMHSIEFVPFRWLSVALYENCVYGQRFDPLYLLPVALYMPLQQLVGYADDNLQMGLEFTVRPFPGFAWATNIFIDDMHFNDLVKLKLNTKIKIAAQTGITWTPLNSPFSIVTADYTLIAPFMYSHSQYDGDVLMAGANPNYQNYTNNGKSLGSNLPPNSDRFVFSTRFEPVKNLKLKFTASMVRHANTNETIPMENAKWYLAAAPETFATDGSVLDYPDAGNGYFSYAQHNFMFMEQPTKMYVWQFGLDASYQLPWTKYGTVTFKAGYVFEYIKNDGVQANMFPGQGYGFIGTGSGKTPNTTDQQVNDALANWKAQLRDVVNNYFSLSVKYSY